MEYEYKEVDFASYCQKCKYVDIEAIEDPCNECLAIPARIHSSKPEYYKEDSDRVK